MLKILAVTLHRFIEKNNYESREQGGGRGAGGGGGESRERPKLISLNKLETGSKARIAKISVSGMQFIWRVFPNDILIRKNFVRIDKVSLCTCHVVFKQFFIVFLVIVNGDKKKYLYCVDYSSNESQLRIFMRHN